MQRTSTSGLRHKETIVDIKTQSYPLPEAIESAISAGAFSFAELLIDNYIAKKECPVEMKERLCLEKHNMKALRACYPLSIEECDNLLAEAYPQYKRGNIHSYILSGALDWRFIDGKIRLEHRSVENAPKRCDDLAITSDDNQDSDLTLRDDNVAYMHEHKERRARIRVRFTLKPLSSFGERVFANIPVVRNADSVEDIKFISASSGYIGVDDENALMRSARFSKAIKEGDAFFIEFEYTTKSVFNDISKTEATIDEKEYASYLKEEAPHILFTPYLKALSRRITEGIASPSEKARAIYNWITKNVRYSYVREYGTIDNLSEYAASNLKGDCGIQALLFITLCRISGVPARWESGWYATPEGVFCHDWAEFYLPEYGWCFADCSFGGGGYRQGKMDRWKYYFGSRDIFRTPINGACCKGLKGKKHYADDPIDNQRGEIETAKRSLSRNEMEWRGEVISFTFLED